MRTEQLGFRAKPDEVEIAERLAQLMECSRSEVLRRLLRAAKDATPAKVHVSLEKKDSDGKA